MNNYKTLSSRYLKGNKKRTVLTIIGIILSVALITCILTFVVTAQRSMKEQTIAKIGDFHVAIYGATNDQIDKFEVNPRIETIGLGTIEEPVDFVSTKKLTVNHLTEEAFDLMNINLEEGSLPKSSDEIVIERWILKYFEKEIKVGDPIEIKDEEGYSKIYTLSGIGESYWKNQADGVGMAYVPLNENEKIDNNIMVLIKIKDKADKQDVISEIKGIIKDDNKVIPNEELLRYTAESSDVNINDSMFLVVIIVICIVVIATVVVIYNAFHISIADRIKEIGLLRAIGTTKKQIVKIVLREATVMILIGIPLGLFFGIVAVQCIALVFMKMSPEGEFANMKVVISPIILTVSALIGSITIYISAYMPARSAGKVSPLIAINNQTLIKKEKRIRSGKILGKFMKIDKAMALKNTKRNKKRFYITVLSMAISVMLFVSFSSLVKFSDFFYSPSSEAIEGDFEVYSNRVDENVNNMSDELINEIRSIPNVDMVFPRYRRIEGRIFVDEKDIPREVLDWAAYRNAEYTNYALPKVKVEGKEKTVVRINLDQYNEEQLNLAKKYLLEGNIDNLEENEIIVVKNSKLYGERTTISPIVNLKIGDEINLNIEEEYSKDKKEYKDSEMKTVKVVGIISFPLFDENNVNDAMNVIGNEETVKNLIKDQRKIVKEYGITGVSIRLTDDIYEEEVDKALKAIENTNLGISYYNTIEANEKGKIFNLQIKILVMGFIIVVSLIGSVNIINTVATNILLRSREISALRAIGMTRKQVKRMIVFEGVIFGLYGGILGSVVGIGFSYLIYGSVNNLRHFAFAMPWNSVIIAIIVVILLGYVSAIIPLRRLKNENIIEGIRGE